MTRIRRPLASGLAAGLALMLAVPLAAQVPDAGAVPPPPRPPTAPAVTAPLTPPATVAITPPAAEGEAAPTTPPVAEGETAPEAAPVAPPATVTAAPPAAEGEADPEAAPAAPAMLAGWMIGKMIWTRGAPAADAPAPQDRPLTALPDGWVEVGRIDDLVISPSGEVLGYVADIGGFLGLGVRRVVLAHDRLHLLEVAGKHQFVTEASRAELEALPGLDASVLRK